jgi:hypothetical protein
MAVAGPVFSVASPTRMSVRSLPEAPECPLTQVIATVRPCLAKRETALKISMAEASSSVTSAGNGAGGVRVDDHGAVLGGLEPFKRVLNGCDLRVKGGLLGSEGPFVLGHGSA